MNLSTCYSRGLLSDLGGEESMGKNLLIIGENITGKSTGI